MRFPCSHCRTLLNIEKSDVVTTCPHCNKQSNVEDLVRTSIDMRGLKLDIQRTSQKHMFKFILTNYGGTPIVKKVYLECWVKAVGQLERDEPIKTITLFNKLMGEGEQNG